ncbi:long tail fiber protein distal subunit [Escherichia phage ime09]|uniref:Long tail fiber protein Gp37 n=1 Tax=Escherichia phage ime09 TaxID=1054834 RepID=G1FHG9_9CAUD|nr:long tail fiber protein distal subunit [Escherichia phage ime09]AEK12502.1 phage tail fiber protein [Escherichia phage ime09]
MATLKQIQFKRSKTAGARPAASVLAEGELAINLKDRTIFTKDDSGNIIDLGIAKGGQIDGNVTINGLLRLNGDYTQTGGMTVNGPIGSTEGVSALVFRSMRGSFYARATNDTSNAHLWFENTDGSERGVLYSKPQSENEGVITMRVRQGTAAGAQNSEFHFISTDGGIFQARKLTALTSISTPTISVNLINHDSKAFGQYDSQSLVQYVYPGTGETNGVNYLRKVRAKSGGTMWHEICTAQTGQADEMSWWTGNTPQSKQYGIRNDGRIAGRNSLALGTFTTGFPSSDYGNTGVMGDKYLVLGDTVTGLKYIKQGVYDLVGGGYSVASITPDSFRSTRKGIFGRSEDQGTTWTMPGTNVAFLSVQTQADENAAGDGQTHIGYNSGGKMNHYFRGKGKTNINTQEGMEVNPGILKIVTGANNVMFYADGGITSTKQLSIYNGVYLAANNSTAGLTFAPTTTIDGTKQILWEGGKRAGQNKSYVTVKAWGNSFNASGDRNRETVFEVADGQGYYFYAQRVAPASGSTTGVIQFRIAGALLTGGGITSSGSIVTESSLVANNGLSVNGQAKFGGTADALRIWNAEYGAIFRRSETNFYIIPTLQNAGESGGISNLRPFTINLANGSVMMGNHTQAGKNLLTIDNVSKFVQTDVRLRVNMDSDAIVVNASSQAASNFIQGRKADVTKWYLGIGDGGNVVRMHNYTYSHGIALNSDTVDITKPLKINDIRIGTDGNITGGTGNFANLNTTLNRKTNVGGWAGSSVDGWYKFATVTIPQGTGTVTFKISGGAGFNFKSYSQASVAEIVLRTGNNNPKGINAVLWNRSDLSFNQIATMNTSGDTYDVYVFCAGYTNALVVEYSCSENSSVTVVGLNGGIQPVVDALPEGHVVGKTVRLLNNIGGTFAAGESNIVTRGEYVTDNQKGMRIKSNGNNIGSNAALIRNDGGSFYILATDKNTEEKPDAANGDWNGLRPFSINMADGRVGMNHGLNITGGGLNVAGGLNVTSGNTSLGNISSRVVAGWRGAAGWGDTSDAMKSKITFMADHGDLSNSGSYYPIVGAYSNYGSAGYRQTFEFGWVGSGTTAGWRDGIIRIRGDNANDQQARWRFTMDGTLDCPGKVLLPQTGAFGVNTSNGLGGNSITFGDNDTGIKQNGDGLLDIYANSVQVFRFQNGDLYSYKNINAPNVYIRSDIRLKSNFKPIENALDKVEKLNGVIYDKAEYIGGEAIETEAGIVAQTLQDVLPEAVRETEDSKGNKILTVSSQAQIALLVEAVKTLSSRVKELESKLM